MSDKIFAALRFATDAHTGQYRKATPLPYIVHPVDVMQRYNQTSQNTTAAPQSKKHPGKRP